MTFRDVFRDALEHWRSIRVVLHHAQRETHVDQLSVTTTPRHLDQVIQLATLRHAHEPLVVGNVGVYIHRQVQRHQLFTRVIAEQVQQRRIGIQDAHVAHGAVHAVDGAAYQRVVVRARAHQHLLREPPLAHVARDGDVAGHRAVGITNHRHARLDPEL